MCSSPRLVKGLVETELVQPAYNLIYMAACTGSRLRRRVTHHTSSATVRTYHNNKYLYVRGKEKLPGVARLGYVCSIVRRKRTTSCHAKKFREDVGVECQEVRRQFGHTTIPYTLRRCVGPPISKTSLDSIIVKVDDVVVVVVLRKTDE